ncbi:MAG: bZIP transcription factor [Haloferacaceae archaeon]
MSGTPTDDVNAVWVSRLVERGRRVVDRPIVAALVVGGWVPVVTTLVAVDPEEATTAFLVGQALAALMVVSGPFDVWYFDQRLLPRFFRDADEVLTAADDTVASDLAARFDGFYGRYWPASVAVWVVLVLAVFVVGQEYFASQGITTVTERAAYLAFFLYWLTIVGLRSHAAVVTVLAIRAFAERATLDLDPLHPDGLGGLGTVGELAIQTTVVVSLGSLALPLSFQIAAHVRYGGFVYAGVALFVLLVAANFLYPTYKMNRRAQAFRERILDEHRERIRDLENRLAVPAETEAVDEGTVHEAELLQLEIQRARREFRDHQQVQLYPLSVGIITRLVSSILLPLFFIVFELFITDLL